MILGRKLRHPLPKVPANVRPTFRNLCATLTPEEREQLGHMVEDSMAQVEENAREQYRIDLKTAREVASRCRLLLEHYDEFSEHEKSLVVGAVRYFVIDDDPLSDEIFATGFHDDAQVINYVLEQLGIEGMFIELD